MSRVQSGGVRFVHVPDNSLDVGQPSVMTVECNSKLLIDDARFSLKLKLAFYRFVVLVLMIIVYVQESGVGRSE